MVGKKQLKNGSIRQAGMMPSVSVQEFERKMFFPVRGIIDGVRFKDKDGGRRTFIDVYCYNDYPVFRNVPILHSKINKENGEDWTPEKGDMVAVQFFLGNINDPVIVGYIPPPDNEIEAVSGDAPCYHKKRSGTSEKIDKAGNRTVHVAAGETLTVVGAGNVVFGSNYNLTAPTVVINASSKVQMNTPELNVTGKIVAGDNVEAGVDVKAGANVVAVGTGLFGGGVGVGTGPITAGEVSDDTGTLSGLRDNYNVHKHAENGTGGGTTDEPIPQDP